MRPRWVAWVRGLADNRSVCCHRSVPGNTVIKLTCMYADDITPGASDSQVHVAEVAQVKTAQAPHTPHPFSLPQLQSGPWNSHHLSASTLYVNALEKESLREKGEEIEYVACSCRSLLIHVDFILGWVCDWVCNLTLGFACSVASLYGWGVYC